MLISWLCELMFFLLWMVINGMSNWVLCRVLMILVGLIFFVWNWVSVVSR